MRLYDPEVQKMRFEITLNSHSGTFRGKPCPPTMCDYREAGPMGMAGSGQNCPYPLDNKTWGGTTYPPMLDPATLYNFVNGALPQQVPMDNCWRHADGQKDEDLGWIPAEPIRRFVSVEGDPRCSTGSASVWPDNGAAGEQFCRQGRFLSNTIQFGENINSGCPFPTPPTSIGLRNRRGVTTMTGIGSGAYPYSFNVAPGSPWYRGILCGAQYTGREFSDGGIPLNHPISYWVNGWDKSLLTAPTNSVVNWQGLPIQAPPADDCAGMIISVKDFTWGCNWDCQPKTEQSGAQVYGEDHVRGQGGLYPPDMQDNYLGGTDHPSLPTCFPYQTLGVSLLNNTSKNSIESLQTARPRARYGRPLNPETNFNWHSRYGNPLPWAFANDYQQEFGPNGQGGQTWNGNWFPSSPADGNPYLSYNPIQGVGNAEQYAASNNEAWGTIVGAKSRTRNNKYNPIDNQTITNYLPIHPTPGDQTIWATGTGLFAQPWKVGTTGYCTGRDNNTGNALCEATPRQAKMAAEPAAVIGAGEVSWDVGASLAGPAIGSITLAPQPPGFGALNEDLGTPMNPIVRGAGWIVKPPYPVPPITNPTAYNPIYSKRLCSFQTKGYKLPNNYGNCWCLATGYNETATFFGYNAMIGTQEGGSMGSMNMACWCAYADYHATDPVKEGVYFPYMPLDEITLGIVDDAGNEMIHRYGSSGSQKWTLPMMSTPWQCTLTIQYIPKKKK